MSDVNQQMLVALKELLSIVEIHSKATGNNFAWAEVDFANEAIAAAEQAQQAEPVARDALISAMDSMREAIIDVYHESVGHSSLIEKKMRQIDISAIADRYAAHPPAVAEPDGYVLVPVEPTRAMLDAAKFDLVRDGEIDPMLKGIYRAMLAAAPQAVVTGWIDPNNKTQKQYLPHIGEPVLFCCDGVTYYGIHTGGSFKTGQGVTARNFSTWECRWMYPPAAAQKGGA